MQTGAEIRPLTIDHFSTWLPLWLGFLKFYKKDLSESHNKLVFERITGTGDHSGFGLWKNDMMIGFVHYMPMQSTWEPELTVYLEDLFVNEDARGTGGGRLLIEAVEKAAHALGATNVYWHTENYNDRARQLYDKLAVLTDYVRYDLAIPSN